MKYIYRPDIVKKKDSGAKNIEDFKEILTPEI